MTLNLTKQTEGCWGEGVGRRGLGLWTLGRVCALVSAVKCVNLVIHRPVPLEIKIYVYKKKVHQRHFYTRKIGENHNIVEPYVIVFKKNFFFNFLFFINIYFYPQGYRSVNHQVYTLHSTHQSTYPPQCP